MNIDRIVHSVAGSLILGSLALSYAHSQQWLWLTAFVGANLLQGGFTNWCLLSRILRRIGVKNDGICGI